VADLTRAKLQEAMPGAPGKGLGKASRDRVVEVWNVSRRLEQKVALWRQA
jgi:hypothetical protein